MRKFFLLLTSILVALSLRPVGHPAIAQDAGVVVADGLNGPMGVLMDESGTLWIIESGTGGDTETPFVDPQTGETIAAKYGETARVVTVAPDGTQKVMTALPSIATGSDIIGGARLATLGGKVYATVGQWLGDPSAEAGLPNMGVVAEIQEGSATAVASTWDFERSENPDGLIADSHPYGLAASPEGVLWVTDAGGNALLRVNPLTGRVRLVTVFEGVPAPFPNPARNNENLTDPVPTSVVGKDGMIFVSLLPGFPFTPGSAKVVTVAEDGTVSDYATGLTMVTDLQLGPDNELYAIQFAEFGETGPTPNSGALVRIAQGEGSKTLLAGLSFPTAVTFNAAGDAYLTMNGVGAPGSGQVVMYSGIAGGASVVAASAGDVAATQTVTDTATMTDTVAMSATVSMSDTGTMTESIAMTDTMAMTDTTAVTAAAAMTETAVMTDASAMTDTATMTHTAAMSDSTAVTDTMGMTDTVAMTDTMAMSDTAAMTDTVTDSAAAPIVKEADPAGATRDSEQAREPVTMPVTGVSLTGVSPTTLPVVALILVGLIAGAFVTRRRQE